MKFDEVDNALAVKDMWVIAKSLHVCSPCDACLWKNIIGENGPEVIFLQYYPVLVNYLLDAIVFLFEGFAIGNEFSFEAEIHPAATRKQR